MDKGCFEPWPLRSLVGSKLKVFMGGRIALRHENNCDLLKDRLDRLGWRLPPNCWQDTKKISCDLPASLIRLYAGILGLGLQRSCPKRSQRMPEAQKSLLCNHWNHAQLGETHRLQKPWPG